MRMCEKNTRHSLREIDLFDSKTSRDIMPREQIGTFSRNLNELRCGYIQYVFHTKMVINCGLLIILWLSIVLIYGTLRSLAEFPQRQELQASVKEFFVSQDKTWYQRLIRNWRCNRPCNTMAHNMISGPFLRKETQISCKAFDSIK